MNIYNKESLMLPLNWNEDRALRKAKSEGGYLVVSKDHYPVIQTDICTDLVKKQKRGSKTIILSDKIGVSITSDSLAHFKEQGAFFEDDPEYQLAFIAFGNGCRIVEVHPVEWLCKEDEEIDENI